MLPSRVFLMREGVRRIVVETASGAYGLLPNRLDGVASLAPGIFTYETEAEGEQHLAVDRGILVKAGPEVRLAVRRAIGGRPLGELHQAVADQFLQLDERERDIRTILLRLETRFIRQFQQLERS